MSGARRPSWASDRRIRGAHPGRGRRRRPLSREGAPASRADDRRAAPAIGRAVESDASVSAPPRAVVPPIERARSEMSSAPAAKPSAPRIAPAPIAAVTSVPSTPPSIMFRITALGEAHGRLGVTPLAEGDRLPTVTALSCERLHFSVDRGVCLTAERGMFTSYGATVFDSDFQTLHRLRLGGLPGRGARHPRRSSRGHHRVRERALLRGAATSDTHVVHRPPHWRARAREHGDVHGAARRRHHPGSGLQLLGGHLLRETAIGSTRRSGRAGQTYLIEGNLEPREARVVRGGVECPALSPDNTRVAFKKRTGGVISAVTWRLRRLTSPPEGNGARRDAERR